MRPVFRLLLRWGLSPVSTLLYTGMLATFLLVAGADPAGLLFWLPLAVFLAAAAFYDVNAYVVQRRNGLTPTQVADAVFERVWPSPDAEEPR
jgi:hypothetical protein